MGVAATSIANNYSHTIYAKCDTSRRRLVELSCSGGIRVKGCKVHGDISINFAANIIPAGFTRILPGRCVKFEPDCRCKIYITIYAWDGKRFELLCDNLPKRKGTNVIVDFSGHVANA